MCWNQITVRFDGFLHHGVSSVTVRRQRYLNVAAMVWYKIL